MMMYTAAIVVGDCIWKRWASEMFVP